MTERPYRLIEALLDALLDPASDEWIKGASHREAASKLLGNADDVFGKTRNYRRLEAARIYGQGVDLFRNVARGGEEAPLLRRVADAIERIPAKFGKARSVELPGQSIYISRDEYLGSLNALIQAGSQLICLWGEPGTGKTELANQVAKQIAGDDGNIITLQASNLDLLDVEIGEALIAEGFDPSTWSKGYCRTALKRRLSTIGEQPRSRCVVIDSAEDENLIRQFIPANLAVPVLLTMRSRPRDLSWAALEVLDFTAEQAYSLLHFSLPSASDNEVSAIAELLGYRPLALGQAINFIHKSQWVSPAVLIESMTQSVITSLAKIEDDRGARVKLVSLYKLVLDEIVRNDDARRVLDAFLAITGRSGLQPELSTLIATYCHPDGPTGLLGFAAGLGELAAYGLVREIHEEQVLDTPDGSVTFSNSYISMNPLTFEILRDLRFDICSEIELRFLSPFLSHGSTVMLMGRSGMRKEGSNYKITAATSIGKIKFEGPQIPETWWFIRQIDTLTWVAVRDNGISRSEDETFATLYTMRFESHPHGTFALDPHTHARRSLNPTEETTFAVLAHLYSIEQAKIEAQFSAALGDSISGRMDDDGNGYRTFNVAGVKGRIRRSREEGFIDSPSL